MAQQAKKQNKIISFLKIKKNKKIFNSYSIKNFYKIKYQILNLSLILAISL